MSKKIFLCIVVIFLSALQGKAEVVVPTISDIVDNLETIENKIFSRDRVYVKYTSVVAENKLSTKKEEQYRSVTYSNVKDKNSWGVRAILAEPVKNKTGETVFFARGGKIFEWTANSKSVVIVPFQFGRNMYQDWTFFLNIGITPFRKIAETNGTSFDKVLDEVEREPSLEVLGYFVLPDSIKNNIKKYQVNPVQEEVDGHKCWVVEWKNADKIWFDSNLSGVIRKRIIHWEEGKEVKRVIVNSGFKEFGDGVVLPMKQEVTNYVGEKMGLSKSLLGKQHSHFIYQVDSIQFDNFDKEAEELSNYSLSPGTSVLDVANELEYTITKPNSDPFAGPISQGITVNRYVMFRAIFIISGSILIFIGVWSKLRNKKA
ncbi:MAG: hypothetical protein LBC74_07825 [Planctomycetaceae bacterium]|jgi:hypothetical protein|nr:hypothetical protein [Planctomycetaceae bacterium]